MTGNTTALGLAVIHIRRWYRYPGGGEFIVTGFTQGTGWQVIHTFAGSMDTVMTTQTIRADPGVIHTGPRPGRGAVTNVALLGSGNMAGRFSTGNQTVVTTGATANDLAMIDGGCRHRRPREWTGCMAGATFI